MPASLAIAGKCSAALAEPPVAATIAAPFSSARRVTIARGNGPPHSTISTNRRQEWLVTSSLVALFVVGLSLLVYGALIQAWQVLVPGGLIQTAVLFPIRKLITLREENKALQILPQLMRLAEDEEAKVLAALLVRKLIEKV